MSTEVSLLISKDDHQGVSALLNMAPEAMRELLQTELDRATVVEANQVPQDVVTMNSLVTYMDLALKKENKIQLVYPHDANLSQGKVSILAPVGAALLGLRVGQTIDWPMPQGTKQIQVLKVERE